MDLLTRRQTRFVLWRVKNTVTPPKLVIGQLQPGNLPVVVVANFSDFTSANAATPQGEYVVPNWPAITPGRAWKEITQDREVPPEWVGREPIYSWEAKVYTPV